MSEDPTRTRGRALLANATLALALSLLATAAAAAPPVAPEQMTYQGVLLDDQGMPRTGSVDLTARIFDSVSGGTLVYVQTFTAVPLSDGVFSIALGPTGEATDTPDDPLTTSLAASLAGDVGPTAPSRFLELTVGAVGALTRTQILTVPYALRAESAAAADTATLAQTATDATNLGGLSSDVFNQIFLHTNLDDSGPGNTDPTEGTGDTDGDGAANFVDPDNDDDGISDGDEVDQGSDINLVTPTVVDVVPGIGLPLVVTPVVVSGTRFDPGQTVAFGTQTPAPQNVTPTSFELDVGPQSGVVDLTVTLPNGETGTLLDAFEFLASLPNGIPPLRAFDVALLFRTLVTSDTTYVHDLDQDADQTSVGSDAALAYTPDARLAGVECRAPFCTYTYLEDLDEDGLLSDETGVAIFEFSQVPVTPSLDFDPAGNPVLAFIGSSTGVPNQPTVAHDRDGDGSFGGVDERVGPGFVNATGGGVSTGGVDGLGRAALAYWRGTIDTGIDVAWDRSGNGFYSDSPGGTPEITNLTTSSAAPGCLALAFAPDGDLALVYNTPESAGLHLARDQNGDGDFADAGEDVVLDASVAAGAPCDIGSAGGPLAVALQRPGPETRLLVDRNDDGDFVDEDEDILLATTATNGLRVAHNDDGLAFVATNAGLFPDPTP